MSQENVEIVKSTVDAYNRRDFDAWLVHFDREVVWWAIVDEPEPGPFQGHEAVFEDERSVAGCPSGCSIRGQV